MNNRLWPLTGKVIDFYDDPDGSILLSLDSGVLEKTGAMVVHTREQLDDLPNHAFGLILVDTFGKMHRKFPLHDEGHVRIASEYLAKTGSKLLPLMRHVAAHFVKSACDAASVPVSDEIRCWAEGDAPRDNVVPIRKAEQHFLLNDGLKWLTMERKLAECAEAVPEFRKQLEKAESDSPAGDEFRAAIIQRIPLITDPVIKTAANEFLEKIGSYSRGRAFLILSKLDEKAGLCRYYDHPGFINLKEAMLKEKVKEIPVGDRMVKEADLIRLAGNQKLLNGVLNSGIAAEFSNSPLEVFSVLPRETQEYIVEELLPRV